MKKERGMVLYDTIIAGCGFAGAVMAREMARKNRKVLIIEKRKHIGGNCYDTRDEHGILIHQYGPHIFHTNSQKVYDYLSQFTEWYPYSHEVLANVHGKFLPVPFNLNSLEVVYGEEKGKYLGEKLLKEYASGTRVPILKLKENKDREIREIAEFAYENIFLRYTMKQWDQTPEEIDPSVTARVPVLISRDNRYFQDTYQGMPSLGYTKLFEKMLDHKNITVCLGKDIKESMRFDETGKMLFEGQEFSGNVIYTGPIDELFECRFGRLPYRSLDFQFEYKEQEFYQPCGVVNYTVSEDFTRITEFKYLTGQKAPGTTVVKEYPMKYEGKDGQIPYYSIINEDNKRLYRKYEELAEQIPGFYLLGRLAEYKYYNIDAIVLKALALSEKLDEGGKERR